MALPTIKFNLLPTFPARVFGQGPVTVDKSGLDYTLGWDITEYSFNPSPAEQSQVLSHDPVTGATERIQAGDLVRPLASKAEAIAGTNNNKAMTAETTQAAVEGVPIKVFPDGISTPVSKRFSGVIKIKSEYGTDLAAYNKAVARNAGSDYPLAIDFEGAEYEFDGVPNDNGGKPLVLMSRGIREATIKLKGSEGFKFGGTVSRVPDCAIRNLRIDGAAMSAGTAINVDWAQGFAIENVIANDCPSVLYLRQVGGTFISNFIGDKLRAGVGVKAIGPRGMRNGEIDKIDAITFIAVQMTGTYQPGVTSPQGTAMLIDGAVQTLNFSGFRGLNLNAGLITDNSYGLPANHIPAFFYGHSLEFENTWLEGWRLNAVDNFAVRNLFSAGAVSKSGGYLGSQAYNVDLSAPDLNSNYLDGLIIDGAQNVTIVQPQMYNNAGAGLGNWSGARVLSGDGIRIFGGKAGEDATILPYTEQQAYGIDNVAGTNVDLFGVDLSGNNIGPYNGDVRLHGCWDGTRILNRRGLPTSAAGLPSGAEWNDGGTVKIVP